MKIKLKIFILKLSPQVIANSPFNQKSEPKQKMRRSFSHSEIICSQNNEYNNLKEENMNLSYSYSVSACVTTNVKESNVTSIMQGNKENIIELETASNDKTNNSKVIKSIHDLHAYLDKILQVDVQLEGLEMSTLDKLQIMNKIILTRDKIQFLSDGVSLLEPKKYF